MKRLIPVLAFIARHVLFTVFAAVAGCLIWSVVYLVLLVIAVFTDQGIGGFLAYPAGLFLIIVTCFSLGWGIFAPASAVGSLFCRMFKLPMLLAIPVVFGTGFCLSYLLLDQYLDLVSTHSTPPARSVLKNFILFLSVPLGLYWWITEGPSALFDAFRRWLRKRRGSGR